MLSMTGNESQFEEYIVQVVCMRQWGDGNSWLVGHTVRRLGRIESSCSTYIHLESKSTGTGFCGVNSPNPCGVLSQSATHDC